jgi:deoxyribose-phosphate aldolase
MVCIRVRNRHVKLCADLLRGSPVKVCTVIGFPLGATSPEAKVYETETALRDGATEIDMVINIGALKGGDYTWVARDIRGVVETSHAAGAIVKVIIETSLLTIDEKVKACLLAKEADADFVKTSTGFAGGGATVEDVALMRRVVGPEMGVKASGGVHTYEEARSMVEAGATRIGASAGVKIVQGKKRQETIPPRGSKDISEHRMLIARVIGTAISTIKDPKIKGNKLLILKQTDPKGNELGQPFVAVDLVDAGEGELVLTGHGSSARQTNLTKDCPVALSSWLSSII